MADKAPYRMTIKLTSARPDAIGKALTEVKRASGEYDQAIETTATLTLESYKEAPLRAVYEEFEFWLYRYKIGIECEVKLAQPGVRPETIAALRATRATPMDQRGWEAEQEQAANDLERDLDAAAEEDRLDEEARGPIIIHPPLALPPASRLAPLLAVVDGEYTIDEAPVSSDAPPR
jgi:hypothetical protein